MIPAEPGPGDPRTVLGREGEAAAERALQAAGFAILDRRFRARGGEVDLVAESGDVLVFVEVKTRSGTGFGEPAEAVVSVKQGRIARTALAYLARHRMLERRVRFDVIEVMREPSGGLRVRHIEDAFRPSR